MVLNPKGKNNMGARAAYYSRGIMEDYMDETAEVDQSVSFIDLRKKALYGKMNLENKVVCPNLNFMKPSAVGGYVTFDFVDDAISELKEAIKNGLQNGGIRKGSVFAGFEPVALKNDWRGEYRDYLNSAKTGFRDTFLESPLRRSRIERFSDFLPVFAEFAALNLPDFPITFSRYWVSRQVDPGFTGLAFSVAQEKFGDDAISVEKYLGDLSYNAFAREAQNHGFIMDRHSPFRLVVNFSSAKMQEYMKNRDILNLKDFFKKRAVEPLLAEFNELVMFVSSLYPELLGDFDPLVDICHKNGKTTHKMRQRETFNPTGLEQCLAMGGVSKWLRLYTFIKAHEVSKKTTQREFDKIVTKAISMNKNLDIISALVYINEEFNSALSYKNGIKPQILF